MFGDPFLNVFFNFLAILGSAGDPLFHPCWHLISSLFSGPLQESLLDAFGTILAPFGEPFWNLFEAFFGYGCESEN